MRIPTGAPPSASQSIPTRDHPGEWAYTLTIDDPAILEDGGETTITSYGSTADGSVSGGDVTASFWEPQENAE